ncbi:MAG TPA: DUF3078 domain-containing protein [Candidatus Kapabacteria bacterium]|nr:DUF3078 domain-containing protein [Candidatus Kapabacteria bacterium]
MTRLSIASALPLLLLIAAGAARAQDTTQVRDTMRWTTTGSAGANFTNTVFSNWAAGGKNSITVTGILTFGAKRNATNSTWENNFEAGLGYTKADGTDLQKSDDRLKIYSNFGYKAAEKLDYSALLDAQSQIAPGFDYDVIDSTTGRPLLVSKFLSPAKVKLGLGLDYKPVPTLSIFVSPISNLLTIVLDDRLSRAGAFGVDSGKKFRSDLGSQLDVVWDVPALMENVAFRSHLNIFAPYRAFTTMEVTWENLLTIKANEYINASVALDVLYDEKVKITRPDGTVGPATQLRNVIALGLAYKLK